MTTAYDELMAFTRETEALGQVAGRLGWDQETTMPRGAAAQFCSVASMSSAPPLRNPFRAGPAVLRSSGSILPSCFIANEISPF